MIELGVLIALLVGLYYGAPSIKALFTGVEQDAQDYAEERIVEVGLKRIERLKEVDKKLAGKESASHKDLLNKFGIK